MPIAGDNQDCILDLDTLSGVCLCCGKSGGRILEQQSPIPRELFIQGLNNSMNPINPLILGRLVKQDLSDTRFERLTQKVLFVQPLQITAWNFTEQCPLVLPERHQHLTGLSAKCLCRIFKSATVNNLARPDPIG